VSDAFRVTHVLALRRARRRLLRLLALLPLRHHLIGLRATVAMRLLVRAGDLFKEASAIVAASAIAAVLAWMVDLPSSPTIHRPDALIASASLSVAVGAAMGSLYAVVLWLPLRLFLSSNDRVYRRVLSIALALAAGVLTIIPAAREGVILVTTMWPESRKLAVWTVVGIPSVVAAVNIARALLLIAAQPRSTATAPKLSLSLSLPSLIIGLGLLVTERTLFPSSFESQHAFVEIAAHLSTTLAIAVLFHSFVARRGLRRRFIHATALFACAWLALFIVDRQVRERVAQTIPKLWEKPVYAARWVRRARVVVAGTGTGPHARPAYASFTTTAATAAASTPIPTPTPTRTRTRTRTPTPTPTVATPATPTQLAWNIVVVFVDTLRADVAHDPQVMPDTVAWMQRSFWFQRAYASGSSTLLTLAPMLGCRYDTPPDPSVIPNSSASAPPLPFLLDEARRAGLMTALVIPKSAVDYHHTFFPSFQLDYEDVVSDVADGSRVRTADEITDRSLAWLKSARPERFLLWLYHYDVHSWLDLNTEEVTLASRYRMAARGVDKAFTRFRDGLAELGLADRTVVLFVSDHGEGLGQQHNFWFHSTYLWESLIRVPLAIHVPGEAPRVSELPVSTVDVATTLSPFITPSTPERSARCHGEDLLDSEVLQRRRHPVLFSAMIDGRVTRVGMLGSPSRKVELDLRDSEARLLRINDTDLAEDDVSESEKALLAVHLGRLMRTPVAPHSE
jgi:hypothetical protein